MTIHHLNCATMHPIGSFGGRVSPTAMVAHCLLVERPDGLLLVDTGFGTDDVADPRRLGQPFRAIVRPELRREETALAQVTRSGVGTDVADDRARHLDLDHVGGLADFPRPAPTSGVQGAVRRRARRSRWPRRCGRRRATCRCSGLTVSADWVRHDVPGDDWFGFGSVTALDDDALLIPLQGHTRGHCGVAVRRPDGGWLLHAGDSYFHSVGES